MKMNLINITRACSLVLAFAFSPGAAVAGVTNIAQLPLLSMDDTGAVKPNLMLLYDNSGSMAYTFTPDYIDDSASCRSKLVMSSGTRGCIVGMPPFNSADFNRQYYDPKVRYLPPVKADGTSYDSQTSANTGTWTKVLNDGYKIANADLAGNTNSDSISLINGFPDIAWCDTDTKNCVYNTATYSYPNDTRYTAGRFYTNPYYYNIQVAEYCTDATLTTCQTTAVGAAAPNGYPVAAKVRWCDSNKLTKCQAKFVGTYKYPRFSTPASDTIAAYGTITVGASKTTTALYLDSVSVTEGATPVVISNGEIKAAAGTDTPAKQATLANAIAASIIAKTGLTNQYTACTRTPTGSVPNCSTFGITLGADNMVAVVPIECTPGATGKSIGQCSLLADATRSGWAVSVAARAGAANDAKAATAVISMGGVGKDSSNNKTTLSSTTLDGTALFGTVTFKKKATNVEAAQSIVDAINANGNAGQTAILAGNAGCTATTGSLCVSTTLNFAAGQKFVFGTFSNNGSLTISGTDTVAGTAATPDLIPVTTTKIGAGSAIFVRVDIVKERNNYPGGAKRSDCAGGSCTYEEEMTNFANWYTYYKSRNQTMKTSVGLAFKPLTENYNVGLVALSVAGAEGAMTRPLPFSGDVRTKWYASLYAMGVSGSTPLRKALNAVGKMYANVKPYVAAAKEEAVQYPCQQNFTFLTTDGYWNGDAADVVDNDNVENAARFCLKGSGCVDSSGKNANSLADVALYWYNGGSATGVGSLRPTLENMSEEGKVRGPNGDNKRLHMNTYTLGLGVDGIMNYEENYNTSPKSGGDFSNLVNGVTTGCPWNANGAYVWPDAVTTDNDGGAAYQSRVDDLWHAAINGRGKYFSASDPTQVIAGLSSALSNIAAHVGAASSAATSTPNISVEDNDIFSSTFTTVQWSGEMTAQKIDVVTGNIDPVASWNTSNLLGKKVTASADTRTIRMLDTSTSPATLKAFAYASMTTLEKGWFGTKCSALSQCANLTEANRTTVNDGTTIVNWLRGQQQYADNVVLRAYGKSKLDANIPVILGDIASSKPAYVRLPRKSYANAGYSAFVTAQAARAATVYVAANDGMLHALDAKSGNENWAYVPRITMKKLYSQAGLTYGTNHQFTADGSPEVGDVQIKGVWKSVLVAGLNAGGRGYYALDVTDPLNPVALWETCADASICTGINTEAEMGQTFGNPVTGTWKDSVGNVKWVVFVTSGYNNIPGTDGVAAAGTGKGWLMVLDIETGKVLAKTSTGSGDLTTPSGLARITAISADPANDPMVTFIYGGDILGQMWRFDLTKNGAPTVVKMGDAGTLQPITVRPDVTYCKVNAKGEDGTITPGTKLMVAFGTGRLLDIGDVANTDKQSVYVLRDSAVGITAEQWRATSSMAKRTLTKTVVNDVDVYKSGGATVDLSTQLGWYVDFDQNAGERVNIDPRINSGYLNVVTNIPASSNACSVGGKSNLYSFDVCDGTGNSENVVGGSLSSTSAAVGFIVVTLPNGTKVIYTSLANGDKIKSPLPDAGKNTTRRTGWRRVRS